MNVQGRASSSREPHIIWDSRKCKRYSYVKLLIDSYGSDILFKPDKYGLYPIHWAVGANGNTEVAKLIIEKGVSPTIKTTTVDRAEPIHIAALEGNISAIDLLVSHGIDINVTDGSGCTPLMRAAMHGTNVTNKSSDTVLHLISCGADPYLRDLNGFNCLHYAVMSNNEDTVHLLINLGMDTNVTTNNDKRALDLAATNGSEYLMRLLGPVTDGVSRTELENMVIKYKKNEKKQNIIKVLIRLAQVVVMVAVFSTLFYAYPQYVFHYFPHSSSYIVLHICLISSSALVWLSWYRTCVSDPGYLAKNTHKYTKVLSKKVELGLILRNSGQRHEDPYEDIRLCHICRTVRSHRSCHCRYCKRCIASFDHHCIYLSTCIGQNNRRAFFTLGLSILVSSILCALLVFSVATNEDSVLTPYHWFNLLYCLQYTLIGFLLTICNLRRAAMNLTQYEELKRWRCRYFDVESQPTNPYDKGSYFKNLLDYFTAKNYKYSQINLNIY